MKSYQLFEGRLSLFTICLDSRFIQHERFLNFSCSLYPIAAQVLHGPIIAGLVRVFEVA